MLCVSLAHSPFEECRAVAERSQMVELRLDSLAITPAEVKIICGLTRVVATCRPAGGDEDRQKEALLTALRAGAHYVDLEREAGESQFAAIREATRTAGSKLIVSFHDYLNTPPRETLAAIVNECFKRGADIVKIACRAESMADSARLLGLLEQLRPLVVIGMGEAGKITRIVGPLLGSLWSYAAVSEGKESAEGQLSADVCEELLNRLSAI